MSFCQRKSKKRPDFKNLSHLCEKYFDLLKVNLLTLAKFNINRLIFIEKCWVWLHLMNKMPNINILIDAIILESRVKVSTLEI